MPTQHEIYRHCASLSYAEVDGLRSTRDAQGMNAVHHACAEGDVPAIRRLQALGFDLTIRDAEGNDPVDIALFLSSVALVRFLVGQGLPLEPRGGGYNALDYPAMRGDLAMAQALVALGANVDGVNGNRPPLVWAVQEAQVPLIAYLVARGADPFRRAAGAHDDESALHLARGDGGPEIVRTPLRALGDPTPLWDAECRRCLAICDACEHAECRAALEAWRGP